jgi:thiol:disulfide interchange protein
MRFTAILLLALLLPAIARAYQPQDWNDSGIEWRQYEAGLDLAQKTHKPICLVFYALWCPHCRNYAKVFSDPRVVEESRHFVMIHVDVDQRKDLGLKYRPNGYYVPRTYFLSPDGVLDPALIAEEQKGQKYIYFYNESDAASILAGMNRALEKFRINPSAR